MPEIKGKCLESMQSPIRHVMSHIPEALKNIAPENKERFEKEYSDFTLEYLDEDKWTASVAVRNKHIKLSKKVVEIIWGISYGYIVFYTKAIQTRKVTARTVVNLRDIPEVKEAMDILQNSYNALLSDEAMEWPDSLPKPVDNPNQGTMENVAQEMCLCGVAYLLHHELAHIRFAHSDFEINKSQEAEADAEATDWLLNHNLGEWSDMFVKRSLAIAIILEVFTAKDIYTLKFYNPSHPFSYERLFDNVDKYIRDPNHIVWAFICATLTLHLDNKEIRKPDKKYDNFKDCVTDYMILLRNIGQNNK